jgi:hypothetical protein
MKIKKLKWTIMLSQSGEQIQMSKKYNKLKLEI